MMMRKKMLWLGILSFWLFFILEIVTDIWFGSNFPGYNWKTESLSYLGQSGSPMEQWVLLWGVTCTILLSLFSYSFYQLNKSNKWVIIATSFLLIYGFGEGMGSGCFPINPLGSTLTLSARLHNIFSGIGDTGIVLFPFILMLMFPKKENQKFHLYLWSVVGLGSIMASFFLIAKYYHPDNFILSFKGVWQRIYIFNYYMMLGVISCKMARKNKVQWADS